MADTTPATAGPPRVPIANKMALTTALTAGLGAAIMLALARSTDYHLVLNYHSNTARATTFSAHLERLYPSSSSRFLLIQSDMSSRSAVESLVAQLLAQRCRSDIISSNAGWTRMRNFTDLEDNVDEDDRQKCFTMNVMSDLWLFHDAKVALEASSADAVTIIVVVSDTPDFLQASSGGEAGSADFVATASMAGVKPSGSTLMNRLCLFTHSSKHTLTIEEGHFSHQSSCDSPREKSGSDRIPKDLGKLGRTRVSAYGMGLVFPQERLQAVQETNRLGRFATVEAN